MDSREGLQDCACQNRLLKAASWGREKGSACDTGETLLRMCTCDFVLIITCTISLFTSLNKTLTVKWKHSRKSLLFAALSYIFKHL